MEDKSREILHFSAFCYYGGNIAVRYFRNIDKSTLRSACHAWQACVLCKGIYDSVFAHFCPYGGYITCDVSEITIKAPCEAAHINERYVRIEISDFVMRTFLLDIFSCILYRT